MLTRRAILHGLAAWPFVGAFWRSRAAEAKPSQADGEIAAMVAEFIAVEASQVAEIVRHGDADWSGDPVLEAMAARRDELFEAVIETRARSVEGIRAKARLFEAETVSGFDADAAMVGRSIAADLRALAAAA